MSLGRGRCRILYALCGDTFLTMHHRIAIPPTRSGEFTLELFDACADVVAVRTDGVDTLARWVVQLTVLVALAKKERTGLAASHTDDDVRRLHGFGCQHFWAARPCCRFRARPSPRQQSGWSARRAWIPPSGPRRGRLRCRGDIRPPSASVRRCGHRRRGRSAWWWCQSWRALAGTSPGGLVHEGAYPYGLIVEAGNILVK